MPLGVPLQAVPAHPFVAWRPDLTDGRLVDHLSLQERLLQRYGAGVSFNLMLRLWPKNHARVPRSIGAVANQKQTTSMEPDHSASPADGW